MENKKNVKKRKKRDQKKTKKKRFLHLCHRLHPPESKLSGYVAATVQQFIDNEMEAVVAYTK